MTKPQKDEFVYCTQKYPEDIVNLLLDYIPEYTCKNCGEEKNYNLSCLKCIMNEIRANKKSSREITPSLPSKLSDLLEFVYKEKNRFENERIW